MQYSTGGHAHKCHGTSAHSVQRRDTTCIDTLQRTCFLTEAGLKHRLAERVNSCRPAHRALPEPLRALCILHRGVARKGRPSVIAQVRRRAAMIQICAAQVATVLREAVMLCRARWEAVS